jgi:hypothetical protein
MIETALATLPYSRTLIECHPEMAVSDLFGGATALTTSVSEVDKDRLDLLVSKLLESDCPKEARKLESLIRSLPRQTTEVTRESIDWSQGLLAYEAVFLEEVCDMSPRVMAAMKSTLTAKAYGGRPSKHKLVVGATNVDPYELLDTLPPDYKNAYHAVLQRFLVIDHTWSSYEGEDYEKLFTFQRTPFTSRTKAVTKDSLQEEKNVAMSLLFSPEAKVLMTWMAGESTKAGSFVSPRVFEWGKRLAKTGAYISGASEVLPKHLHALSLMGDWDKGVFEKFEGECERLLSENRACDEFEKLLKVYETMQLHFLNPDGNKHFWYLRIAKSLGRLLDQVNRLTVTDTMSAPKSELMRKISVLRAEALVQADGCAMLLTFPWEETE